MRATNCHHRQRSPENAVPGMNRKTMVRIRSYVHAMEMIYKDKPAAGLDFQVRAADADTAGVGASSRMTVPVDLVASRAKVVLAASHLTAEPADRAASLAKDLRLDFLAVS